MRCLASRHSGSTELAEICGSFFSAALDRGRTLKCELQTVAFHMLIIRSPLASWGSSKKHGSIAPGAHLPISQDGLRFLECGGLTPLCRARLDAPENARLSSKTSLSGAEDVSGAGLSRPVKPGQSALGGKAASSRRTPKRFAVLRFRQTHPRVCRWSFETVKDRGPRWDARD